jgi:hypothetical protein
MVRMSEPSDRVRSTAYASGYATPTPAPHVLNSGLAGTGSLDSVAGTLPRPRQAWSGSGGRWVLWPLRAVLWAAILIVAFRGITAIIFDEPRAASDAGESAATEKGDQFPVALADAYALEFGQVYLNYDATTRAEREQELAAFLPPALAAASPDLGWNGSGQERLQSEQVAGISVQDSRHAVVSLLVMLNGQLMELGVPVYASGGGVAVTAAPAWLPAPQAISPPASASQGSDPVAQSELLNELPAFFQAYASSDTTALSHFLAPGVRMTGLGGGVTFDSISSLVVPPGGSVRHITVTVVWQVVDQDGVTSAKLTMAYGVSVVDLQTGKWYVMGISASTEAVGAQ